MEKQLKQMKRRKMGEKSIDPDFQTTMVQQSSRWVDASLPSDKINVKDYSTVELTNSEVYSTRLDNSHTAIS